MQSCAHAITVLTLATCMNPSVCYINAITVLTLATCMNPSVCYINAITVLTLATCMNPSVCYINAITVLTLATCMNLQFVSHTHRSQYLALFPGLSPQAIMSLVVIAWGDKPVGTRLHVIPTIMHVHTFSPMHMHTLSRTVIHTHTHSHSQWHMQDAMPPDKLPLDEIKIAEVQVLY